MKSIPSANLDRNREKKQIVKGTDQCWARLNFWEGKVGGLILIRGLFQPCYCCKSYNTEVCGQADGLEL